MHTLEFSPEQEGVSAIVGLVLVLGLVLGVGLATYISNFVPEEQRDREYLTERQVEESFRNLSQAISALEPGGTATAQVKMGAEPSSAMLYTPAGAVLTASPARYVDQLGPWKDTYVCENGDIPADDVLRVSPTENKRQWTYIMFDLRYTDPYADPYPWYSDTYNQYESPPEFYDDVRILSAKLWLFCDTVNLQEGEDLLPLQIEIPVAIDARPLENDFWDEDITWNTRPSESQMLPRVGEGRQVVDDSGWVAFDVTSFVDDRFRESPVNNFVSFCLREPENSSLDRRAAFISKDVETGYYGYRTDIYGEYGQRDVTPYLEIVFSRGARAGDAHKGLVDAGYIKFDPNNISFPEQQFVYEGGGVIQLQYNGYDVMISPPHDFIVITPADGNNIRVTVTRYRVTVEGSRGGVAGQSISGTGWASVSVSVAEESYLKKAGPMPNEDEVTITIRSDHSKAWLDYIRKQLVPRLNYIVGGEWDEYGTWVRYDYDRISITIYGKDGTKREDTDDIYYTEKVVDLLVTIR